MTNIAELLKDCPKGTKLYSPLFGEVFLYTILSESKFITVRTADSITTFNELGQWGDNLRWERFPDAECLLFPSKEVRTWEGWKAPVEPKFKVGDWVVKKDGTTFYGGNYAEQITIIESEEWDKRIWFSSTTWLQENDIRLWTIADARDGDVLATDNGWTCIFQAFDGYGFSSYCFMDSQKWFCESESEGHTLDSRINGKIHPATKEQRGLLFAKMKEAGYEWDANKKKLRKIKSHYDISNFYAGMPVLVRDYDNSRWSYVQFSHYVGEECGFKFNACGIPYIQCIPFNEETKHLLGTTDMCPEEFINW